MSTTKYARQLGARLLSEANDLKRTVESLADELGVAREHMGKVVRGEAGVQAALEVIDRMGQRYPLDAGDLRVPEDDTHHGVRLMRAADSKASARVFDRKDRSGGRSAYYEYRDTAMSRVAPFRPEWIKELRVVADDDPNNPDVAFNKGHFLHQYTLFVGPVNYYWELNGQRFCRKMSTGDSVFGTPWWPHTFTSRDASQEAYILAVTFGGEVRRAQKELYALGAKAQGYVMPTKHPKRAFIQLVRQLMANDDLTLPTLEGLVKERAPGLSLRRVFDEAVTLSWDELTALAACLSVEPSDLYVPPYKPQDEVLIQPREQGHSSMYPGEDRPLYRIERMARTTKMPLMRGATVHVLTRALDLESGFCSSLHAWVYNYGSAAAQLRWFDGGSTCDEVLAPGDSACIQPFVRYAFAAQEGEPRLCVIRVAGAMGLSTQRELSAMSDTRRVFEETGCWFD